VGRSADIMATSSRKPEAGKNRLPDTRYVKTVDRFRLHNPNYTMAFATKQVQQGFRLSITPSMLLVKRGQEYRVDGDKLWNRGAQPTAAFKALLHHFAMNLLQKGGRAGRNLGDMPAKAARGSGYLYFMHPQVQGSPDNIHCTHCHMPNCSGFLKTYPDGNCPYYLMHDEQAKKFYTMVNLGKDKHGKVVWERAHAILAAARWGIPDAVFDITLDDSQTPQALHTPCCPQCQGGCLNPLHIQWGLQKKNRQDQETKKGRQNRGKLARNRTPVYNLVPD